MKKPIAGSMMFADLTVPHASLVKEFYQAVLGWEIEGVPMKDGEAAYEDYMTKDAEGNPVGGVCHARGVNLGIPPVWMLYMHVEDPQQSMDACERMGGEIVRVVKNKEGNIHYAMLRDPQGLPLE